MWAPFRKTSSEGRLAQHKRKNRPTAYAHEGLPGASPLFMAEACGPAHRAQVLVETIILETAFKRPKNFAIHRQK